jgi:lactate permease
MVAHLHRGYLALAPWAGGISGYIAGSNTGGNAMLAAAQANAARQLGYPAIDLVAVQTLSASLLTMASAPRVALAETLSGNDSGRSAVARVVLTVDAAVLLLVSGLVLLLPASLMSGHVPR